MTKTAKYIFAALFGAALIPGCTREAEPSAPVVLTAVLEQTYTRTAYDGVLGKLTWTEGDQVAVHVGNSYQTADITPSDGHLAISETSSAYRNHYAVYPASVADAGNYGNPTLKVNLPASYDISDIVSGASAIRTSDFSPCPMVAVNDTYDSMLRFYHVGGLLRITLTGVKAATKTVTVTFDKDVTGSYTVNDPATDHPTITTGGSATNNVVTFIVVSSSAGSTSVPIVLNVPVPCGTYNSVTVATLDATGASLASQTYDEEPLVFLRHHGKKLAFGELAVDFVLQHTGTTVTLSDGTIVQEVVRAYDSAGSTNTAPFDSYRTNDGGMSKEDVEVSFEYAESDADGLPVRSGGEIAWSSTRPSELSSVTSDGSVNKVFSAKVTKYSSGFVKEMVSEFLKHAENLKSRTEVGSSASPYDLSMYDIHGTSRGNKPVTANSYVVDRAGWYMFPIVYGNAIDYTKSGKTLYSNGVNAYAYKDAASPADNENYVWHNFQNFTGTSLISTPYVLDDCGSLISSDVEAVVVWQDVESDTYSFIENVAVTNIASSNVFYDPKTSAYKTSVPYIKFQVPTGSIDNDWMKDPLQRVTGIRQGNAVIAVRLKSARIIGGTSYAAGTILWSWHIWITDGFDTDGDDKGDGLASIPVTNHPDYGGYTLNMMPVNMGWCDTKTTTLYKDRVWYVRVSHTSDSAEPIVFRVVQKMAPTETASSGTFYQWGRKDPFIPSKGKRNTAGSLKAAYSPAGYTLTSSANAVSYNSSPAGNASTAIQNPFTHYFSGIYTGGGWLSSVCPRNFWNMVNGTGTGDVAVSKTVYDPCPPGYCVPRRDAFRGFTTTGKEVYTYSKINMEDRNGDGALTYADIPSGGYNFYTTPSPSSDTPTIFFPYDGRRGLDSGSVGLFNSVGAYWSAAPNYTNISSNLAYNMYFYSEGVSPGDDYMERSFGASVRPVEE